MFPGSVNYFSEKSINIRAHQILRTLFSGHNYTLLGHVEYESLFCFWKEDFPRESIVTIPRTNMDLLLQTNTVPRKTCH